MAPTHDNIDERSLLLSQHSHISAHYDEEDKDQSKVKEKKGFINSIKKLYKKLFPLGYYKEFRATLQLSWAITFHVMSGFVLQPTAVIMAGRMGKLELDAVALSNTLINVCGYSIMLGLCTGIDTVFAQVYGSINRNQLGIHLQKSLIVLFIALMPSFAIFLNISNLLVLLGQDPRVASMCGRYMLVFLPGLLFLWLYSALNSYMRCQNIVRPQLVAGVIVAAVHIAIQYVFVMVLEWGIEGSSLGLMLAYGLLFLFNVLYIIIMGVHKKTWSGFSLQCLAEWSDMCKLALSGLLMTGLEWWAFEISIILAGVIGTTELGAQSIALNIQMILWTIGGGFSIACCIRIGQSLGAGKPLQAVTAVRVGYTVLAAASFIGCTIMAVLRYQLPAVFTTDQGVIDLAASILPIVAVYTFFDSIATMGRAITRGTGRQIIGTFICFTGHYIFALPIGVSLMFLTPLKTRGLWIGFAVSLTINSAMFFIYTNFMCDYDKLSQEALHRSGINLEDEDITSSSSEEDLYRKPLLQKQEVADADDETKNNDQFPAITSKVILRRVAAISVFLGILLTGILCRLFIPDFTLSDNDSFTNATYYMTNNYARIFKTQ